MLVSVVYVPFGKEQDGIERQKTGMLLKEVWFLKML
jgi:hypothetical protein